MVQQGATLQQWAAATRWSGPADGPVDAQGVPRIPQQGVFLELWRSIGSVRFTSDCVRVCVCVCVRARARVCASLCASVSVCGCLHLSISVCVCGGMRVVVQRVA